MKKGEEYEPQESAQFSTLSRSLLSLSLFVTTAPDEILLTVRIETIVAPPQLNPHIQQSSADP